MDSNLLCDGYCVRTLSKSFAHNCSAPSIDIRYYSGRKNCIIIIIINNGQVYDMECGANTSRKYGPWGRKTSKDWKPLRCGYGEGWRESAGWNAGQMKRCLKSWTKKDP